MEKVELVVLRDHPQWLKRMAEWFSARWGIAEETYAQSMRACLAGNGAVPQWYAAVQGGKIVGGIGVIDNDFHPRGDLSPNICAVYVEKEHRGCGIAGLMLACACADMAKMGVDTLYLLTDHESFYERYGWRFLCMVTGDGEEIPSRMYVHHQRGL